MLQVTAAVIDQVQSLRGTQIVSVLNTTLSTLRGAPHLCRLLTNFFQKAIVPVLSMIEKWIFMGEIDDPHKEFFLRMNRKETAEDFISDNFWDDRFSIIDSFVPKFIPPTVIDRIFSAGKAQSILVGFTKRGGVITKRLKLEDLLLETSITEVCQQTSHALISVFKKDHDLVVCFETLRRIFMCERGDCINTFIRSADFILRRTRQQIVPQDFEPHICAIFDAKYVKFIGVTIEDEQLAFALQSIHAVGMAVPNQRALRKSRVTSSKTLWEYFSFVPIVKEPLNLILTQAAQKKYQFLFRHFLLWRRLEQKFCHNWKMRETIRQINVQRHSMHVFITSYLNYMSATVVTAAWSVFEQRLANVADIEHLSLAHENLLQSLMKGCFLLNEKVYRRMSYLAMMCWHFAKDLKKWAVSVARPGARHEGRRELAEPVLRNYPKFMNGVSELIKELRVQAERDVDQSYAAFILCLTVNHFFEKES
jgi:gamma-tubulin complex component 3